MFDALDELIKNLLVQDLPVKKNDIDIVFDQPNGDWSSRLNKPALNLYLYGIYENRHLRGAEQLIKTQLPDGNIEIRRNPVRIDLHYLVTAWSKNEQDQHHLLGLVLFALLRNPVLPEFVYARDLGSQILPVSLNVAQDDESKNWGEFWSTLNNRYHPGLTLKVTMTIDPYQPEIAPPVRTAEVSIQQTNSNHERLAESRRYWAVGGEIISEKYDPSALMLIWEEKNITVEVQDGRFSIRKVAAGSYHLTVRIGERILKRLKFSVPNQEPIRIEI